MASADIFPILGFSSLKDFSLILRGEISSIFPSSFHKIFSIPLFLPNLYWVVGSL